jgi:carboxymethylenebutenolidase
MTQRDLMSLCPKPQVTRREFVVSALSSGFALAARPISAQTITTDTQGLEAGEVTLGTGYDSFPGYRAMPASGGGAFPVVLVVQEIFGVHEHIKDVCRRLAKAGYLAVAPELFARQGDVSKLKDINEILEKVVSKVPDQQVMKDLDITLTWAEQNKGDVKKLGITGFCYGGRIVWLYAAHNADLKAGVAWYGRVLGAPNKTQPKHPIDVVKEMKAPVLGLYGGKDQGIPVSDVEDLRGQLKAAGKQSEIVIYPEAAHGFHADYRPSYRKEAAEDGWKRMLEWFKKYGVA